MLKALRPASGVHMHHVARPVRDPTKAVGEQRERSLSL